MEFSDFFQFLSTRSSVRTFNDTPVSSDEIGFILRCASTAPSAGNREAWDVVVVTDQGILENLADAAYQQEHVADAPVLFVTLANYIRSMSQYGKRGMFYAVQDATIATSYMMLGAHALGLHSCWTGSFEEDLLRDILGLPTHIRPIALLAVGKGTPPRIRTGRMSVEEHTHQDIW